jgi:hypothetical protein
MLWWLFRRPQIKTKLGTSTMNDFLVGQALERAKEHRGRALRFAKQRARANKETIQIEELPGSVSRRD